MDVEIGEIQEPELEDDIPDTESIVEHKVKRISAEEAVQNEFCITSSSNLLELICQLHGSSCSRAGCEQELVYRDSYVGTFLVNWTCAAGHFGGRWASQPTCSNLRVGNLLLASAILLSGNSFTKIGFLFKIMKLKFFLHNLFNQYQNLLIAPVINSYWEDMQKEMWKAREGKDTILSGDSRNDSPGHCAQYCTYSFADMESQSILQMNIVEVEGRKSPNMERVAFERGLDSLL